MEELYTKKYESLSKRLKETNEALDDVMRQNAERNEENKRTHKLISKIKQETDDIISNFEKDFKSKEAQLAQLKYILTSYMESLTKKFSIDSGS